MTTTRSDIDSVTLVLDSTGGAVWARARGQKIRIAYIRWQ